MDNDIAISGAGLIKIRVRWKLRNMQCNLSVISDSICVVELQQPLTHVHAMGSPPA